MGDVAGSLLSVLDGVSPISILVAVVGLLAALLIRRKLDTVGAGKDVGVNRESKESVGTSCKERKNPNAFVQDDAKASSAPHVKVVFGTQGGKASRMAQELAEELRNSEGLAEQVVVLDSAKVLDPEEFLTAESSSGGVLALLVSTYTDGAAPESARWLDRWLEESAKDFRVQRSTLRGLRFSVFGLGDSAYGRERFNAAAKRIDRNLRDLGAVRVLPVALGDDGGSLEADFEEWKESLVRRISAEDVVAHTEDESQESALEEDFSTSDEEMKNGGSEDEDDLVDLEDIGEVMAKAKVEKKNGVLRRSEQDTKKEMLNPSLRKSLTKQGYKLVGSHSGVKICRWTKAMLRGRGGCYKHSFYGIASHRCMESTPSLACANKCVFCWRHHSNPVGTEWKWAMDPPELILEGALEGHYKMVKQMRGVPGVKPERMAEAMDVKHCALSLVGEPIMYPEINRFIDLLHSRGISSFLVTNAQFPSAIRAASPVTQLYVSIDAPTKDSLKKIDRPLFRDFWERFVDSLRALAEKGQRTVYRLTLVKGWNTEEMDNYAKLVEIGKPDFIEVKGVTYCGTSKASTLTMENVPWHEEVLFFVQQLADRLPGYSVASEHEHSNCVLIASDRFRSKGNSGWRTWIDYEEFHRLARRQRETGEAFTAMDYAAETPDWAVFGSSDRGFDPEETRFHRNRRKNNREENDEGHH